MNLDSLCKLAESRENGTISAKEFELRKKAFVRADNRRLFAPFSLKKCIADIFSTLADILHIHPKKPKKPATKRHYHPRQNQKSQNVKGSSRQNAIKKPENTATAPRKKSPYYKKRRLQ